jgi:class 3 adenylate cyclase
MITGSMSQAHIHVSEQYRVEKIKTIGDCYMMVSGLPTPRPDHAEVAAELALALRDEMANRIAPHGRPMQMRIGIHSGPVVAGVIGTDKFAYDLWGDTVNTASRTASRAPSSNRGNVPAAAALLRVRRTRRSRNQGQRRNADLLSDRQDQVVITLP